MPLQFEDVTPLDISGDPPPTRPLTKRQMAGAQSAQVNRTRQGPQVRNPARQSPTQTDGQADQKAKAEQDKPDAKAKPEVGTSQPEQATGLRPGGQALIDGIGQILNDPAWQEHPLLHFLTGGTVDPTVGDAPQRAWEVTQWWGRAVNALIDPNAIHASAQNIEHDNSVGGRIKQNLFGIYDDPASEFVWNLAPYALAIGAEWAPWMWLPSLAAAGPSKLQDLPQATMGLVGGDLLHPQFQDPEWYARVGTYLLSSLVIARSGGKAAPLLKYTGRLKIFEPFAAKVDRYLGGPGTKTPIKGPDGQVYDHNIDPEGYNAAKWWQDGVAAGEATVSEIGAKPQRPIETYTYQKIPIEGLPGEYAERRVPGPSEPSALPELAQKLGLTPTSSQAEVRQKLAMLIEERELTPQRSGQILKEWQRYGPALDMWEKVRHVSPAEAPFRSVPSAAEAISHEGNRDLASKAMRAGNGFHSDVMSGVHSYGNDLVEALSKGVLSHSRSAHHYGTDMVQQVERMLVKAETGGVGRLPKPDLEVRSAISRAVESPGAREAPAMEEKLAAARRSGDWLAASRYETELERLETEGYRLYDDLAPEAQFTHNLYRRMEALLRDRKQAIGYPGFRPQPDYFRRVPRDVKNLEAALKDVPDKVRVAARAARSRSPFTHMQHEHRAIRLTAVGEQALTAETAYKTTDEANAQRAQWREQIKQDLIAQAKDNSELKKVTSDPRKLDALVRAELPDFSTDIMDAFKAMLRDFDDVYTYEVMQTAKRTLVQDERDGRFHPLAVARNEAGQESSDTLSDHFKYLHGADTTTDFYRGQLGYKPIEGLQAGGLIFHPRLAEPINNLAKLYGGDGDKIYAALRKAAGGGKHLIMLNPMWHATNMAGRFAWLTGMHPVEVARTLLKANGMTKGMTREEAQTWWDAQEHEYFNHGGVTPQLHEDVVSEIGRQHALATGDVEVGMPIDVQKPVEGFKVPSLADAWNATKGVDAWYQQTVNDRFWHKYRQFGTLAYVVLKNDALRRGESPGNARILAASQANRWAGMTSPDRWAQNPFMYKASQLAAFAPNWWRTFPGIIQQSYDRMGLSSTPALTNAWALNTAKAVGAMLLTKFATDNALNWLMSGHWQSQNDDGYKNRIAMDRFFATDPRTGAHHVMEDPFERQPNDLETALGLTEAMQQGYWRPEFAEQGLADVILARQSPLLNGLETASNLDLYGTIKNRSLRWVDPQHPYPLGSGQSALAGLAGFTPAAFAAQAGLQGSTAAEGTIDWGPFKGTKIPGWAMRAFDPNDPAVGLLSLLGTRGGYPAAIRTEGRGLSTEEQNRLTQYQNEWHDWLAKQQQDVASGGETWSDFAYKYRQQAALHAGKVQGVTDGTSNYKQGAAGLLTQYEATYNDPQAFDSNGDINWAYIDRAQGELQAKTDPATWRQMIALKDKTALQYPVLRAYKDSLQNYRNFQDTEARKLHIDGESLRAQIAEGARSPDFRRYEAAHPALAQFYRAKRQWELETKQGFAYGLFTNNTYVMRVVAPTGDVKQVEQAEQTILPQIEAAEAAGTFVTPSGQ